MANKKANSSVKQSVTPASTNVTTVTTVKTAKNFVTSSKKEFNLKLNSSHGPLVAGVVAELIGTFLLTATVIASQGQPIAVLFGLAGIVLAIGAISGAHVNPAMTIGALLTRRISGMRAICYIVAQLIGAMLALALLGAFIHAAPASMSSDGMSAAQAPALFKASALPAGKEWLMVTVELIGTAILGFAIANATREKKERSAAGLTAGLGIYLALFIAGSAASVIGGTAILNPAIAMALQAIPMGGGEMWASIGVYVVTTIIGGVLGFFVHDFLRAQQPVEVIES